MPSEQPRASVPKPILLVVICIVALICLPHPLRLQLFIKTSHNEQRNGPLPPPQPKPEQTSTKVFSPRTQREISYLSKPFLSDFLSLSSISNIFIVDLLRVQYAYCQVAHAGNIYHEDLLRRIHGPLEQDATNDFCAANMQPEYVTPIIRDDDFPKYIMVRNPIQRTLSSFLHIEAPNIPKRKHVQAFHKWVSRQFRDGTSFTAEELNKMNQHWIPQHIHCGMHKARVFKIFKYEYPERLVEFLEEVLRGNFVQDWRDPSAEMDVVEFVKFYNDTDVFDRVRRFCKRDIEMFRYHEEVETMRQTVLDNMQA